MYELWEDLKRLKRCRWVELSHPLNNDSPYWGGIPEGAVELSCCTTVEGSRALARKKGIAALVILTAGGMTEEAV